MTPPHPGRVLEESLPGTDVKVDFGKPTGQRPGVFKPPYGNDIQLIKRHFLIQTSVTVVPADNRTADRCRSYETQDVKAINETYQKYVGHYDLTT